MGTIEFPKKQNEVDLNSFKWCLVKEVVQCSGNCWKSHGKRAQGGIFPHS